jgi:hypothetical protein
MRTSDRDVAMPKLHQKTCNGVDLPRIMAELAISAANVERDFSMESRHEPISYRTTHHHWIAL